MKQVSILFLAFIILLTACTPTETPAVVTETEVEAQAQSTATQQQEPTETQAPTETELPENTPTVEPTEEPEPTPTSIPPVIDESNARQLELVQRVGDGKVVGMAFSPDTTKLAVLTSLDLMLFEVETGDLIWDVPTGPAMDEVKYSMDGLDIVTRTHGGSIFRWNAENGEYMSDPLEAMENMRDLMLSYYGDFMITTDKAEELQIWDTRTGQLLQTNDGLSVPGGLGTIAVSPDGETFLLTGIDSKEIFQIRLWRTSTGRFLRGLRGMAGEINDLRFYDIGEEGHYVTGLGTKVIKGIEGIFDLYIWDVDEGTLLGTTDMPRDISDYTILKDDASLIVVRAAGTIQKYSFRNGRAYFRDEIIAHETQIADICGSEDGLRFATIGVDGTIKIWDSETMENILTFVIGKELSMQALDYAWEYESEELVRYEHPPFTAVSHDESMIAQTSPDLRAVYLRDRYSGELLNTFEIEMGSYYSALTFSPDDTELVAALNDYQLIFWDIESGLDVRRLTTSHRNQIFRMEYTPDGNELVTLASGEFYFWDPEAMVMTRSLVANRTFDFSDDGEWIAADGLTLGLNILHGDTGRKEYIIDSSFVYDLDISPDGTRVAIAGYEFQSNIWDYVNNIKFVDLETQKYIPTIELLGHPNTVQDVKYSPDGSYLLAVDAYGTLYVWEPGTGVQLQQFREVLVLPAQLYILDEGRTIVAASGDNSLLYFQVVETE